MTEPSWVRTTESKRLDAFVDAAFAFAVTLLLIAGAEPIVSIGGLQTALLNIPTSACCFALVAVFWQAHRSYGRLAPTRDAFSTLLSLAVVFSVLVYVFPLRMLVSSGFHYASQGVLPGSALINSFDDLKLLYVVYGFGFAFLSLLFVLLFHHTAKVGERLGATPEGREGAADSAVIWLFCMIAGLVSVVVAVLGPLRQAPFLPGFCYWIIPLAIWLRYALIKRAKKKAALQVA
ncbi:MAG: transglutaminase-like protein [Caulobacter sp.]|nr:transglutaminase-like protein [Caulobacter sp.]